MSTSVAASLPARLGAELPLKFALLVTLSVAFCVFYFGLQHVAMFPVRRVPETFVDRAVLFDPGWVWTYQSIYLVMPVLPWLATDRDQLARYAHGFALLSVGCFAVFLFVPVEGPRPAVIPDHWGYQFLVSYDSKLNAFPFMHVGLTVYTFLVGYELLRERLDWGGRRFFALVAFSWTTLILYAMLATKQHWAVDLPPGMIAAWGAYKWAWRPPLGGSTS